MDVRLIYWAADMDDTAPVIVLVGEDDARTEALSAAARRGRRRYMLLAVSVEDWNRDLSPWPAPAVFRGGEDFAGGADEYLAQLLAVLPAEGPVYLLGYSLAGLFALYAATRCDRFEKVAALSPSVWYPGFAEYLAEHLPEGGRFYLSLGRKEEKAGSAVLRSVGENLRAIAQMLDVPVVMHDGGHYTDVEKRLLAALAWMLSD